MKPKHKFNLIIALVSVSILITLTGIAASVHHCIKWADYCKNENLSATVVEFSQNMIFHASLVSLKKCKTSQYGSL